jgi:hypothetical protein
MNAPKYKPNISRTDTELVEEDIYTDSEELLQESDISSASKHRNNSNISFASATVGEITSLIEKTYESSLQQPFEFVGNNNTIYSYLDNIFSCEGGFYSANQITVRQTPGLGWYILFTILLSVVFI